MIECQVLVNKKYVKIIFVRFLKVILGTSLAVQWLRIALRCKGHQFDPWPRKMPPTTG